MQIDAAIAVIAAIATISAIAAIAAIFGSILSERTSGLSPVIFNWCNTAHAWVSFWWIQ